MFIFICFLSAAQKVFFVFSEPRVSCADAEEEEGKKSSASKGKRVEVEEEVKWGLPWECWQSLLFRVPPPPLLPPECWQQERNKKTKETVEMESSLQQSGSGLVGLKKVGPSSGRARASPTFHIE